MKENILNLISNLQEQLKTLVVQLQEQAIYNLAKDYYQNSSVIIQKLIKYIVIALCLFILIYIPYSSIKESNEDLKTFLSYKNLAQKLIQSKTTPLKSYHSKSDFSFNNLKQRIKEQLRPFQLSEDQTPKINKVKNGMHISISWINLQEFSKISATLEKIHPQLKMIELNMSPAKENLYFNVTFKFKYFNISKTLKRS